MHSEIGIDKSAENLTQNWKRKKSPPPCLDHESNYSSCFQQIQRITSAAHCFCPLIGQNIFEKANSLLLHQDLIVIHCLVPDHSLVVIHYIFFFNKMALVDPQWGSILNGSQFLLLGPVSLFQSLLLDFYAYLGFLYCPTNTDDGLYQKYSFSLFSPVRASTSSPFLS